MTKYKTATKYEDINSWRDFIMEDSNLTYRAKLVAFTLSQYFRPNNATYPSVRTMSEKTNLTVNPVQSGIKELIEKDYITRDKKRLKGNRFTSNIYGFLMNDVSSKDTSNQDISIDDINLANLEMILYKKGETLLKNYTTDSKAIIKKWLNIYKNTVPVVLNYVLEAQNHNVRNPVAWIEARLRKRTNEVSNQNSSDIFDVTKSKVISMDSINQFTQNL